MVFYPNPANVGTRFVSSLGDGYTINVTWFAAEHSINTNKIAYHIYYSTDKDSIFYDGVKYASIDGTLSANIINLIPGQEYFVAVRPVEYDPLEFDLTTLPIAYDNLRYYPSSILKNNISATDTVIPLIDVEEMPATGIVNIGRELIQFLAVDRVNGNLIAPAPGAGVPPTLIDQGGGNYYVASSTNIGAGTITGLIALDNINSRTETWTVRCIFVEKDGYGNPVPQTACFISIGSLSGDQVDGYGNPIIWKANGTVMENSALSFAITETSPIYTVGDSYIIKVNGSIAGAPGGRGYNNTVARLHYISGYDGYENCNPTVSLYTIGEDTRWDLIYICQSRFEYPNAPFTITDGYRQDTKDLLSTDYTAADAANVTFPMYDYAGWHRTDPVQLLNGTCVGSYIGGEMGCIDGYGNYQILRGFSLQEQNIQREDMELSVTGTEALLIQRVKTGSICPCYQPSSEYQDDRCPMCYGTKYIFGYQQYYNPRTSNGRIQVRLGPTTENLKMYEAGLESEFPVEMWTITVPTIYTRDVIILFDQDDNESFRYEVAGVTRNQTILGLDGGQKLNTFRVRKTDPIYQIRVFKNTGDFPSKLNTSISFVPGIPPHTHEIVINEKILSITQINQTTAVSQGHSHPIVDGEVMEVLGHTHNIILP